jgi:hypothetical protein
MDARDLLRLAGVPPVEVVGIEQTIRTILKDPISDHPHRAIVLLRPSHQPLLNHEAVLQSPPDPGFWYCSSSTKSWEGGHDYDFPLRSNFPQGF